MKENIEHLSKYIRDHSRNSNKKIRTSVSRKQHKSDKKLKSRSKSRKINNMNSSFLGSLKSSRARGSVYSSARRSSGRKSVNSARSRSGTQNSRRGKQEVLHSNYYKSYDRRMEPLLTSDLKQSRSILKNQNYS